MTLSAWYTLDYMETTGPTGGIVLTLSLISHFIQVASVVDGKRIWRFDLVSHSRVLRLHAERGADFDLWMNALKAAGCTDRRHVSTHSVLSI